MSEAIKVGDKVKWMQPTYRNRQIVDEVCFGTVVSIRPDMIGFYGGNQLMVRRDDGMDDQELHERDVVRVAPTATAIVAAFVALPDDYAESRERAINSLRMRDLTDDYDLVRAAGDLGGAEIDLWGMTL